MVVLDGVFYRVMADGRAFPAPGFARSPFAVVTFFDVDDSRVLQGCPCSFSKVIEMLETMISDRDACYAVRLEGEFQFVKTRSFQAQQRPYQKLDEVLKGDQSQQLLENVQGTLVGFWFPVYMGAINFPGFHFHFLSRDRKRGGHVLDFALAEGKLEMDLTTKFHVEWLPRYP